MPPRCRRAERLKTAGRLLASYLPSLPDGAAIVIAVGAVVVAVLRLPPAAVVLTLLLTSGAGTSVTPLIIMAVVIMDPVEAIDPRKDSRLVRERGGASSDGTGWCAEHVIERRAVLWRRLV